MYIQGLFSIQTLDTLYLFSGHGHTGPSSRGLLRRPTDLYASTTLPQGTASKGHTSLVLPAGGPPTPRGGTLNGRGESGHARRPWCTVSRPPPARLS
eukprot:7893109-Pyramimonas_sp.AAC.1